MTISKLLLPMLALAALPAGTLHAQNITGSWQGTLKVASRELRTVFKISLDDDKLKAVFYSIDQPSPPINVNVITRDGATIKMTIAVISGGYEGKLSADGNSITGTFSQAGTAIPLNLARATPVTAWTIPEPPPPPRLMAASADPSFEVATIKPSKPDAQGMVLTVGQNNIVTTVNMSLSQLMTYAYGIHPRQISGGPAWIETEKYDITAKPDTEGQPNDRQFRGMLQKLLTDRFLLTFHREKKELSVYAISVGKTGSKLTKSEGNPNSLPGFGFRGMGDLVVSNATIVEFAGLLQANVLERPVVDQTALPDRYNFSVKWTPDASQFGGRGGNAPPPADNAETRPDLFTAFQQQLGLKIESTKAPVDVLVIDKVEKPSDN